MSIDRNEPVYVTKGAILDLIEEEKLKIAAAAAAEIQRLKERIKRLEKAGDEMSETTTTPAAEAWRKAKETTP